MLLTVAMAKPGINIAYDTMRLRANVMIAMLSTSKPLRRSRRKSAREQPKEVLPTQPQYKTKDED